MLINGGRSPCPMSESPFPAPGSAEHVLYDTHGAGGPDTPEPPITGHDTIHLIGEDGGALCQLDGLGGNLAEVPRIDLDAEIDECEACRAEE